MKTMTMRLVLIAALAAFQGSCTRNGKVPTGIAVFVPGVVSGSPVYEMLVEGTKRAAASRESLELKIIEAGFNQAEWYGKLNDLAASGSFDLIVTSNPAMPELCAKVSVDYPAVRFIVADAYLKDNTAIHTVLYNQLEQGYLVGYLAGLLTVQNVTASKQAKRAGIVIAQTYPTLDRMILPGFEAGLKAVDPGISLETRLIGNWFDANRAAELARALYESGVSVILPIAGGAGQGVIAAARERGGSVVWFDGAGYIHGPDVVVGCAIIRQDMLVEARVKSALSGDASIYGRADIVAAKDGFVDFDFEGEGYKALPEAIRSKFEVAVAELKKGSPDFTMTTF
ncbi:MAG: BMP family ABC transporter substrate-binding protein [Spirochaetes bacterium]|nr:BMP family ABC transporter substrate-binding protein [Spirochaetota bacterium]